MPSSSSSGEIGANTLMSLPIYRLDLYQSGASNISMIGRSLKRHNILFLLVIIRCGPVNRFSSRAKSDHRRNDLPMSALKFVGGFLPRKDFLGGPLHSLGIQEKFGLQRSFFLPLAVPHTDSCSRWYSSIYPFRYSSGPSVTWGTLLFCRYRVVDRPLIGSTTSTEPVST